MQQYTHDLCNWTSIDGSNGADTGTATKNGALTKEGKEGATTLDLLDFYDLLPIEASHQGSTIMWYQEFLETEAMSGQ